MAGNENSGAKGKYNQKTHKRLVELHEKAGYTLKSICDTIGISYTTYYDWLDKFPKLSEDIKKAEASHMNQLNKLADTALAKKLKGYDYEEVSTEVYTDGGKKVKKVKKTMKHVPPSDTIAIFVKKNTDQDFSDKFEMEVVDKSEQVVDLSKLTKKELATYRGLLAKAQS